MADPDALTAQQRSVVTGWFPGLEVLEDLSWGLVGTTVLRASTTDGTELVVKAGDAADHHIAREIRAHQEWTAPWTRRGRAARMVRHDAAVKLLVTTYLPGVLVLETPAADDPDTYRQAGELLAALHGQAGVFDPEYERRENVRTLAWLDGSHRIPADDEAALRTAIGRWLTPPATLVPTHGDWQPRNWLVDDGVVRVIDLGRAELRSAATDLARLAARDFRRDPAFEAAFLAGYGRDPREPGAWLRTRVREAVGTAAWAFAVGDEAFEAEGLGMVAELLDDVRSCGR